MRFPQPILRFQRLAALFLCVCVGWAALSYPAAAATFTVTTASDAGAGSLRQMILNANANPGLDTIAFNIPGTGPFTITPGAGLPAITDPALIDGTTQPGYAGTPLIEINGANLPTNTDGLIITGGGSTLLGLAINLCPRDAIRMENLGSNVIQGNFLGTDPSGTLALGNGEGGVVIDNSPGNLIGGTTAAARNLISGGNQNGIYVVNPAATENVISGNYIGTTVTGLDNLSNIFNGIEIYGAPGNIIGGTAPGAGNIISGNGQGGIYLFTFGATGNLIEGNYIGLNVHGNAALGNTGDGVTIYGVPGNTVGGTSPGARNIISGNGNGGVDIATYGATGNTILGNYIGTDASGKLAIPNQADGVIINGIPGNTIGGTNAGAGNVISGNAQNGILIYGGAFSNLVQGNFVGVDATGSNALPNTANGLAMDGATANLVGGANGGNVISGNSGNGILVVDAGGGANKVQGNLIGPDSSGKNPLGNAQAGLYIQTPANLIGGLTAPLRNVISGNLQNGIVVYDTTSSNNLIEGNYIGADITGQAAMGNGIEGVAITNAPVNTIGGPAKGAGNVISANGDSGILLGGSWAAATVIQGNYIGTDATGGNALGNLNGGISLYGSGTNLIGGAVAGAGNLISGNFAEGISIGDPGANYNIIQGNFLGTKADGSSPLGNQLHNIDFLNTASNNVVGGTAPFAGNRIAFVQSSIYDGVRIRAGCLGNFVSRNSIFSNGDWGIVIGNPGLNTSNVVNLTKVISDNVTTSIQGSLNTYANGQFLIQFYENAAPDATGYGEGLTWVGSATTVS